MSVQKNTNSIEELKIAYLVKLIDMVDQISWKMANPEDIYAAAKLLATLTVRIEITGETDNYLSEIQEAVTNQYDEFMGNLSDQEIRKWYARLLEYMNKSYFADFHHRPPTRERSMKDLELTVGKAIYGRKD